MEASCRGSDGLLSPDSTDVFFALSASSTDESVRSTARCDPANALSSRSDGICSSTDASFGPTTSSSRTVSFLPSPLAPQITPGSHTCSVSGVYTCTMWKTMEHLPLA
ncbi:hypothetical protein F442_16665 [Phytophthora nicotianae P10297]|uniref:Uncharacterized protein n=1 Tax=Phytophthora nicotianae P10297 TaxID=1317064 RepID=W2YJY4_PHYNI|nr:hypothetical protein F442_16665 [Phytophthora nicotianae P10297]